jgi:hypothetical protein
MTAPDPRPAEGPDREALRRTIHAALMATPNEPPEKWLDDAVAHGLESYQWPGWRDATTAADAVLAMLPTPPAPGGEDEPPSFAEIAEAGVAWVHGDDYEPPQRPEPEPAPGGGDTHSPDVSPIPYIGGGDTDPCGGQGWTEGPPAHHPNCDGQCLGGLCPIQTQVECDWPGHRGGGDTGLRAEVERLQGRVARLQRDYDACADERHDLRAALAARSDADQDALAHPATCGFAVCCPGCGWVDIRAALARDTADCSTCGQPTTTPGCSRSSVTGRPGHTSGDGLARDTAEPGAETPGCDR